MTEAQTKKLRKRIQKEADPVGFLIKIAKGEGFEAAISLASSAEKQTVYPTLEQRLKAQILLEKKLSDSSSEEGSNSNAALSDKEYSELKNRLMAEIAKAAKQTKT